MWKFLFKRIIEDLIREYIPLLLEHLEHIVNKKLDDKEKDEELLKYINNSIDEKR